MLNPDTLRKVIAHLKANPKDGRSKISAGTGLSSGSLQPYILEARARIAAGSTPVLPPPADLPAEGERSDTSNNSHEIVGPKAYSVDELLERFKVDRLVWEVDRVVVNRWEVASKDADGNLQVVPVHQCKVFLRRKPGAEIADAIRGAIEWVRATPIVPQRVSVLPSALDADDPHLLEISLHDLHLGKLCWAPEVGENYDLKIAEHVAMLAAVTLTAKASAFPIRRALLPVGNDLLHVDSNRNETFAGTRQDTDVRAAKSFRVAVKLMTAIIEHLRTRVIEGVDVLIIPGNHDTERSFYLGEVLAAMYANTADVRIDNSPSKRKYFRYGATLLGFTHGDKEKHAALPAIMAGERRRDWADTTHHEWHLGHLHTKKETQFHSGNEIGPVRVRVLPSLTPPDAWHFEQGYVCNKRAAEAYLWSHRRGYSAHLSWSPPEASQEATLAA